MGEQRIRQEVDRNLEALGPHVAGALQQLLQGTAAKIEGCHFSVLVCPLTIQFLARGRVPSL